MMQVSQTKHTMAVEGADKQLLGYGINKTLAFTLSDDFCFHAKQGGKVEKIDDVNKLAILLYDDGTRDAIDLDQKMEKNSNGGFFTAASLKLVYAEGESFEKDDILAYNPQFFKGKGKNIDYSPGVLAKIAVAPNDMSYEDSTVITDKLGEKCKSKVTMLKQVALGPNTIVHSIVKKNQMVNTGDHLIDFTTSFEDEATTEFLAKLADELGDEAAEVVGNDAVKTKYSGRVADIKIYYNVPLENLSESLQKLIKKYSAEVEKRRAALGDIKASNVHIPPITQQNKEKVGTMDYQGVLIEFYVEYEDVMGAGDKLTYATALKGVISRKLTNDEAPISEYRPDEIVEAILTPTGIISRMTCDIFFIMMTNKCLIEIGNQIAEIWNS